MTLGFLNCHPVAAAAEIDIGAPAYWAGL